VKLAHSNAVSTGAPRRRRRRWHPLVTALVLVALGVGIGWLWYWVFSPMFTDPEQWVANERRMRRMTRRVLYGGGNDGPTAPNLAPWPPALSDAQARVLRCADAEVARQPRFTTGYHKISYPWGDLPAYLVTPPDLVIRCLRATGLDLQQLIHIDRTARPKTYPLRIWNARKPDRNIDHRRLPNLYTFIRTYAQHLPTLTDSAEKLAAYQPGDLVFYAGPGGGDYPGSVAIVTDRRDPDGVPRVVTVTKRERYVSDFHRLNDWLVFAHFRVDPDALLDAFFEANPTAALTPKPPG